LEKRFRRGKGLLGTQSLRMASRRQVWRHGIGAFPIVLLIVGVVLLGKFGRRLSSASPVRTYATAVGQQATVTLADGSRALLGPATTLSVRSDSPNAGLDLHVIGQAMFTVAHNQKRPFRVHVGNAVARVLGTTFLVRQYAADRLTSVVVTEGRVSLQGVRDHAGISDSKVLTANMLGTVNDSGQVLVLPNVAVEDYTGWTRGQLVFHKTLVRDAVIELGRAYGVEIRVSDSSLAAQTLNCTVLVAQQSLEDVLEPLSVALDAHAVLTGRVITLVPGRVAPPRSVNPRSPYTSKPEGAYGR
jgi:transmembrane sensor